MSAAKHRGVSPDKSPAVQDRERQAILHRDFRYDLVHWIGTDRRIALRVMKLVEEIIREPFTGVGKPEPLKHNHRGAWSRRITDHHRMEYIVSGLVIQFIRARSHHER
jgi:toxin YoeB